MRLASIVLASVVVAGCGDPLPSQPLVVGESSINGGTPNPNGDGTTCFQICPGGHPSGWSLRDPWNGQRGYIIYDSVANFDNGDLGYGLIGLDSTMKNMLWKLETTGKGNLAWYLNLPGTIPTPCTSRYTPQAGQVGSGNTNTGGGNQYCDTVCPSITAVSNWQTTCQCTPESTATACSNSGDECGASVDNCKKPITCGTCSPGMTCRSGGCVCSRGCPKGMWQDSDCSCGSGLPR